MRFLSWVAIGLTVGIVVACGSSSPSASSTPLPFKLVTPGTLIVAVGGNNPPWLTVSEDQKSFTGALADTIYEFAKTYNLKVTILNVAFAAELLAVQQGQADFGTGFFYSAARAKTMYYTYPFEVEKTVLFTLKSFNYTGPDGLKGKKVGVVTGHVWAPSLQKWDASSTSLFPTVTIMNQALLNGQIQAFVNGSGAASDPLLQQNASAWTTHPINVGDFGIPQDLINAAVGYNTVQCSNHGLAEAFDAEVDKLRASGKLLQIYQKAGGENQLPTEFAMPAQGC